MRAGCPLASSAAFPLYQARCNSLDDWLHLRWDNLYYHPFRDGLFHVSICDKVLGTLFLSEPCPLAGSALSGWISLCAAIFVGSASFQTCQVSCFILLLMPFSLRVFVLKKRAKPAMKQRDGHAQKRLGLSYRCGYIEVVMSHSMHTHFQIFLCH